jgi:uncharacterized surface protein with fasciclin (FAS1) repeats
MRKFFLNILLILCVTLFFSCEKYWEDHYDQKLETVNQNVWESLKGKNDASKFVELVEKYELDSLFTYSDVYTLFVPTNQAINNYLQQDTIGEAVLAYHILKHYIHPGNIRGIRKIQTLMLKFAQFEKNDDKYFFDGIPVSFTSPLYINGRYYLIDDVATPKPSLYEYISRNNQALKKYIDDQDSIILDKELSKPLGFDDKGNTIYDSVITVINLFEEEYFEVSEEFRLKTATLVFPKQETYNNALTNMALKLGGTYDGYDDIAEEWQQDVLIPYLLKNGIFANMLEPQAFFADTIVNIVGDSAWIFYQPVEKTICSNGYAYDYREFEVPDTLFMSPLRTEGESLLKTIGSDRFAWSDSITVVSDETFVPDADYVVDASNDSILKVQFPNKYNGNFSIEFETEPLFPRRYLMLVRTHMDFGGLYEIFVNDKLVKTFDYYDYIKARGGIIQSSVEGIRFQPVGRYNKFDFWVDNITEYGRARVKFVYKGPSSCRYNGLMLDYIECLPENMVGTITRNP